LGERLEGIIEGIAVLEVFEGRMVELLFAYHE